MSRKEIRLQRRVKDLEGALRPFSKFTRESDGRKRAPDEIYYPAEGDVWLYVGQVDELSGVAAHLHTDDFKLARRLVR